MKFQMMASGLDICVCNPCTGKYTTFEILIKTDNPAFTLQQSRTKRRFNDFCWLKKILKRHHPMTVCPELPEKKFSDRFDIQFLVQRMKELEDWLHSVVSTSLYLSDTAFHMFLQTSLSCKQIEQYLKGNLPEADAQRGYKDAEVSSDNMRLTQLEASSNHGNQPGPATKESSPIQIRTRDSWMDTQERSDSGIAEYDTDIDSSYDSSGSPFVQSIESGVIYDKYPPLTEVLLPSPCKSDLKSGETLHENIVQTTININPNVKLHHTGSVPNLSNIALGSNDIDKEEDKSSDNSAEEHKGPEQRRKSSVTHKVEMGVLFSLNS